MGKATDRRDAQASAGAARTSLNPICVAVTVVVTLVALLVAASATSATRAFATPSTPAIAAKQAQVAAATTQVDEYAAQVEMASEDYFAAQETLKRTENNITITTGKLKALESDLEAQQAVLAQRAADIYRGGQADTLEVIFGVRSFKDMVTAFDYLSRVSRSDADMVVDIRRTRAEVSAAKEKLVTQREAQKQAVVQASAKRDKVNGLLAEQQRYLDTLGAQLKALIETERARLAAEAAAKAASSKPVSGGRSASSSLGSSHPEVVTIARKFVGLTPYVWGGTTPSGFDCSGLTLYSYREIGIYLPRTSRSQYQVGEFIPANRTDLLEPGDLLFFGYDRDPDQIHHVAIYSGGGKMIHAPYTGVKVSETYLSSRSDYVGAVRP